MIDDPSAHPHYIWRGPSLLTSHGVRRAVVRDGIVGRRSAAWLRLLGRDGDPTVGMLSATASPARTSSSCSGQYIEWTLETTCAFSSVGGF